MLALKCPEFGTSSVQLVESLGEGGGEQRGQSLPQRHRLADNLHAPVQSKDRFERQYHNICTIFFVLSR